MALLNGVEDSAFMDEDNDQSKPLLGDYVEGNGAKGLSAKVAEYLPHNEEKLGFVHRVLRVLYGHLPREDVPRILWVSCERYLHADWNISW